MVYGTHSFLLHGNQEDRRVAGQTSNPSQPCLYQIRRSKRYVCQCSLSVKFTRSWLQNDSNPAASNPRREARLIAAAKRRCSSANGETSRSPQFRSGNSESPAARARARGVDCGHGNRPGGGRWSGQGEWIEISSPTRHT